MAELVASSRVLVVAGKGGVGKTTVGATLAVAAGRLGLDVMLVELEGHSALGQPFGRGPLAYVERDLERFDTGGRIRARRLTPDEALDDYLDASGLGMITARLARSGAVDVVTTAAPGIRDLLTLGKIRQMEQGAVADLIVVDAPASGHAISFLRAPAGLAATTSGGPVRDQAELALAMLADGRRCQVVLVAMPEENVVSETVETAFDLEDEVGVKLGPIVVNRCWPDVPGLAAAIAPVSEHPGSTTDPGPQVLVEAARFRLSRIADQRAEIERLGRELPLPTHELPQLFGGSVDRRGLDQLADTLVGTGDTAE